MGLFSRKKDEKKVDSNFLIEAKDRIIASVKGDRSNRSICTFLIIN
jgi:hypothetical protein